MECPNCKVDLTGDPIPEKDRALFGNATHFERQIGIYYREKDGVIRHMRTDQFKVLRNDTFDISNEQTN